MFHVALFSVIHCIKNAALFFGGDFLCGFSDDFVFRFFSPTCLFGISAINARNALFTLSESGK